MRLGRKPARRDKRTLKLAKYMTPALPPAPATRDWTAGLADFGMMLNDRLGDCTIAGCAHAIQIWTMATGTMETPTDLEVQSAYERWDGYNPADPATDQGGVELDVLNDWRKQGLQAHKLLSYAAAATNNLAELRQAVNLFGGIYIGLQLPLSAQDQDIWDVSRTVQGDAGSWGGHCVFVCGYDEAGFTCVTWGAPKRMTDAFMLSYCDEAYALLGADWMAASGAPSGFNLEELTADLAAIC
jgi:hypothetical protein